MSEVFELSPVETRNIVSDKKRNRVVAEAILDAYPNLSPTVEGGHCIRIVFPHKLTDAEKQNIRRILRRLTRSKAEWQNRLAIAKQKDAAQKTFQNQIDVLAKRVALLEDDET